MAMIKDRRRPARSPTVGERRRTYAELVERQPLTKLGKISRENLSRYDRATLDAGPPVRHYSVESQISRNEKFAVRLIHKSRFNKREHNTDLPDDVIGWEWPDDEKYRAAKARGHILKVVELKAVPASPYDAETPYDVMDRLGLTMAEQERIGKFHVTLTWS